MKNLFLFSLILLSIELNAQLTITTEVNTSDYPNVEFSFNNKNPEEISESSFIFSDFNEGNKTVVDSFEVTLIDDTSDYSEMNKCVIILLEKSSNKKGKKVEQVVTFYNALYESLSKFVNKGDKIKIVEFSLRDDGSILNDLNSEFTDDVTLLEIGLDNMSLEPTIYNTNNVTEIYGALVEAIDQLDQVETKMPKSILLLSEEMQNKLSSGPSSTDVTEFAKKKNILINTIKYNTVGFGQHSHPTLSSETYGERVELTRGNGNEYSGNKNKKDEAKTAIINILNNTVQRSTGLNYQVNLKLNNDIKDGKNRQIVVELEGSTEKSSIKFNAKGNWLVAFFQTNLYIALACCLLVLILIILIIIKIRKNKKRRRQEERERLQRQREIDNEQESEILKQKNELQSFKNKETQEKKQAQLLKDEELRSLDEKKLLSEMKNMGQLPILKYSSEGETLEFTIDNPNLTVGRDAKTNRLCVPNNHISRNHFRIVFSEGNYTIYDNKSANGINVNGRNVEKSILYNGDVIQVANATFTFIK